MFAGKPVIGILGGIGSGKSFVARLFGELGCLVISSDEQVQEACQREDVRRTLAEWWGPGVLNPDGSVNRSAIAARIFADSAERRRLEQLLHPLVDQMRRRRMEAAAGDPAVLAFVWDTPLLLETGLNEQCDAVVFVESPPEQRLQRVRQSRGWSRDEWARRENSQAPLDKKREMAKYMVRNTAGADEVRHQVRDMLSRILDGR
jgi:dephospho-CoA kinase